MTRRPPQSSVSSARVYRDAYDEVREWGDKVRLRDELRTRRQAAQDELTRAREALGQVERAQGKGARNVDRRQGNGLTRALRSVVGRADGKRDEARGGLDASPPGVETARAAVERAAAHVADIDEELAGLSHVDARYTEAFVGKTARILAGDDDLAAHVRALAAGVARAADELRELDEAIAAGRWAQRHLTQAQEAIAALDDAEAAAKTSRLESLFAARSKRKPDALGLGESLEQAQVWVERFVAELRRVPARETVADALQPHGPLLSRYVALLRGRSQAPGQRARETIAAAAATIDDTLAALEATRHAAVRRHADARADYRAAVENA